jgi:hypothetical protein
MMKGSNGNVLRGRAIDALRKIPIKRVIMAERCPSASPPIATVLRQMPVAQNCRSRVQYVFARTKQAAICPTMRGPAHGCKGKAEGREKAVCADISGRLVESWFSWALMSSEPSDLHLSRTLRTATSISRGPLIPNLSGNAVFGFGFVTRRDIFVGLSRPRRAGRASSALPETAVLVRVFLLSSEPVRL